MSERVSVTSVVGYKNSLDGLFLAHYFFLASVAPTTWCSRIHCLQH